VEAEFFLTMDAVRHFYESLDFQTELEQEYRLAHGKDNENRRVGAGLVIIRPTSHTRLYSIISPLAASISAGNCVLVEVGSGIFSGKAVFANDQQLQDTLLDVDSVLREILPKALDSNIFYISRSITDEQLLKTAVLVDQTAHGNQPSLTTQLLSSSTRRAVAIVDRTADIETAAKTITTARFSFGGSSPYAPDIVMVNEFVKDEFIEACKKHASLMFSRAKEIKRVDTNQSEATWKTIKDADEKHQVSSFGPSQYKLVDVLDRSEVTRPSSAIQHFANRMAL
jgi:hypothetical protein